MNAIEKLSKLAAEEYPKEIARANAEFEQHATAVESHVIKAANNARYIGLMLKEWIGRDQVKFEFFNAWVRENQSKLPAGYDSSKVKNFIRIANRLEKPVTAFQEAKQALQLTFETAGLLEVEPRVEPQKASPITPLTHFMNTIGAAREKVDKWIENEPIEVWPADRKLTVKTELQWAHDLYEKLK